MTIRKQLIITIVVLLFLSIVINSVISSSYINNYFRGYIEGEYEKKVVNIQSYAVEIITDDAVHPFAAMELENYLDDFIVQIVISDINGEIIIATDTYFGSHRGGMMMMNRDQTTEEHITLSEGGKQVGMLMVVRNGTIYDSLTLLQFIKALRIGTIGSGIVVLILAIIMTIMLSKKLTKDLKATAILARDLSLDQVKIGEKSKIIEINTIQIALQDLSKRLRMQKVYRKEKIDEIAHETRTPLTILRTHLEAVNDGIVDLDQTRINSCLDQISQLEDTLTHIEDIIESENNQKTNEIKTFDLSVSINKVINSLQLQFETKQIKLYFEEKEHLKITSNESILLKAIYSIITNAYKYTPNRGEVIVKAFRDNQQVIIEIVDTGIGIKENEINSIFDPYFRGENAKDISGDGLGLYIAKQNIEALAGTIIVESVENRGTSFKIIL